MKWCIIDLETTGVNPKKDRIIEIGAVKLDDDGTLVKFQTLVDPGVPLPPMIVDLTGITNAMLVGQPVLEDVIEDFADFIYSCVPVAHNSSFEASFLHDWLGLVNDDWLDSITLAKMAFPFCSDYKLETLVSELNLSNSAPHRALADAEATALLVMKCEEVFRKTSGNIVAGWREVLKTKHPLYGDYLEEFCDTFDIPTFLKEYKREMVKEEPKNNEYEPFVYTVSYLEIEELFCGEKGLASKIKDFQLRESQLTMAKAVGDAFNDRVLLLAEAGTGTGKTFAYLVPSLLLSLKGNKPVIISTHTINLQDQLMNKDIPLLDSVFDGGIKAALVKGRSHYLCYRKWLAACNGQDKELAIFMSHLLSWAAVTDDGDSDVFAFNGFERRMWSNNFAASFESCLGGHCPYFRNKCFVSRVRKQAEKANLIVVNHSLLLADSMRGGSILPASDYLIIDEAHQLEKVAEETLGCGFSYYDHTTVLSDIRRFLTKLSKRLLLPSLFATEDKIESQQEKVDYLKETLNLFDSLFDNGDDLFKTLRTGFENHQNYSNNAVSKTWRVDKWLRNGDIWENWSAYLEKYFLGLSDLRRHLDHIGLICEEDLFGDEDDKDNFLFLQQKENLGEICSAVYGFLHSDEQEMVAWLEAGNDRVPYPLLRLAPLSVAEALAVNVYDKRESVVFVSATLSVNNKFAYFKETCGIDLLIRPVKEIMLPSPFDYEHNSLLVAINDIPLVNEVNEWSYIEAISNALIDLAIAGKGRMLALFTSHSQLREVFSRIEAPLKKQGITVLAHELSGSRTALLEALRKEKRTLILGANSFWEGIDVAGENLSLLVIVKLPFWPPDMPQVAAKTELLEAEHRNSFYEYSLPRAVVRFKQGFGRLLRKEDDKGIVCVLDRRITEKRYGKAFVNSLPNNKIYSYSLEEVVKFISERL